MKTATWVIRLSACMMLLSAGISSLECECGNMWAARATSPAEYVHLAFEASTTVFLGQVAAVSPQDAQGIYSVSFRVERSWKGVATKTIDIPACGSSDCRGLAGCPADFKVGNEFLVFWSGNVLGECSGQIRKQVAAEHLEALGPPIYSTPGEIQGGVHLSSVMVKVVDEHGGPLSGANVQLSSASLQAFYRGKTDSEGSFSLSQVASAADYSVTVDKCCYGPVMRRSVTVGPSGLVLPFTLSWSCVMETPAIGAATICGFVTARDCAPIAHAEVRISPKDNRGVSRAETEDRGWFMFSCTANRSYVLSVRAPGYAPGRPIMVYAVQGSNKACFSLAPSPSSKEDSSQDPCQDRERIAESIMRYVWAKVCVPQGGLKPLYVKVFGTDPAQVLLHKLKREGIHVYEASIRQDGAGLLLIIDKCREARTDGVVVVDAALSWPQEPGDWRGFILKKDRGVWSVQGMEALPPAT